MIKIACSAFVLELWQMLLIRSHEKGVALVSPWCRSFGFSLRGIAQACVRAGSISTRVWCQKIDR